MPQQMAAENKQGKHLSKTGKCYGQLPVATGKVTFEP